MFVWDSRCKHYYSGNSESSSDHRNGKEKQQIGEDWRGNCFGMYIKHG